jgi:type II secretory pathway predicted ATPase ExeA
MMGIFKRYGFLNRPVFRDPLAVSPKIALGLDEAPLMAGETNRYYFDFPLLSQQIDRIKILSTGPNLVTLVIGERGSGKTTLLNQFLRKSGLSWHYYRLQMPTDEGQLPSNEGRPLFISDDGADSRLVMDDAHRLDRGEMKQILASAWTPTHNRQMPTHRRRLAGIILFCEPRLRASLADLSQYLPAATVINRLYMPPLTRQRTEAYLIHRFRAAGHLKALPFSPGQLDEIHRLSRGLPGWVNGEAFMLYRRIQAAERHARHIADIAAGFKPRGLAAA